MNVIPLKKNETPYESPMEKDRTRLEFFFRTFLRGKKWNTHWGWVKLCISFDENHELTRFRVILVGRHYLCRVPKFDTLRI